MVAVGQHICIAAAYGAMQCECDHDQGALDIVQVLNVFLSASGLGTGPHPCTSLRLMPMMRGYVHSALSATASCLAMWHPCNACEQHTHEAKGIVAYRILQGRKKTLDEVLDILEVLRISNLLSMDIVRGVAMFMTEMLKVRKPFSSDLTHCHSCLG